MVPKRKIVRSTKAQLKNLVEYMSEHREFGRGEYSQTPIGIEGNLRQWERVASLLSQDGPTKTIDQWRITWRDLKRRAREEVENAMKIKTDTGHSHPVSAVSSKIVDIIGINNSLELEDEKESVSDNSVKNTHSITPLKRKAKYVVNQSQISDTQKRLDRTIKTLNQVMNSRTLKPEEESKKGEDDCDYYAKHLAIKLRRYPVSIRESIMYKIDGLLLDNPPQFVEQIHNSDLLYSMDPLDSNSSDSNDK